MVLRIYQSMCFLCQVSTINNSCIRFSSVPSVSFYLIFVVVLRVFLLVLCDPLRPWPAPQHSFLFLCLAVVAVVCLFLILFLPLSRAIRIVLFREGRGEEIRAHFFGCNHTEKKKATDPNQSREGKDACARLSGSMRIGRKA